MFRKSLIASALALATATVPATVVAQASNYSYGTVWEVTRVKVLPGQFENYMDYLAGRWKKIQEFGKKEGVVVSYRVLGVNNARHGEPNLVLLTEYRDYLTNAQRKAYEDKLNAFLSETNRAAEKAGGERVAMREQMGSIEYQELVLK